MWPDNETDVDLLGFQVHADLIEYVVTDVSLLPITVGVFGDWGSGKSSVMKMVEDSLKDNDHIATIYFNGWQFEGYDDARSALIYSILIELAEHRNIVPEVKTRIKKLIKNVDWLRVALTGYQVAAPFLAAWATAQTGMPVLPATVSQPPPDSSPPESEAIVVDQVVDDITDMDLSKLLKSNPANEAMLGARQLRNDFADLIAETDLQAVVILVDDLDRCDPKRLVETLEAIKLFLTVPHVAFVIGADERIVRYAIAKRYETEDISQDVPTSERQTDLVTDYLEKLVQVPYYLPRLSQSEIETYMSLLFCKHHLGEHFDIIHSEFKASRVQDITGIFDLQRIQEIVEDNNIELPDELVAELTWCGLIAPTLSDFLKGNPRQTKRLLNALVLRRELARAARIEDLSDQILVKLLLLQYLRPRLFAQLYRLQASQKGVPKEIEVLESWALNGDSEIPETIEQKTTWTSPSIRRWLGMPPKLSGVDLRNYFWITRDRIEGILSGVAAIPRHMRQIIYGLVELDADGVFPEELKAQIQQLPIDDQSILLDELEVNLKRVENKRDLIWVWSELSEVVSSAPERLIDCLDGIPSKSLPPATPARIRVIAIKHPQVKGSAEALLKKWAKGETIIARASQDQLRQLKGETD